jgi:predicted TIM-barrel fold metal-dependent hydrolase
LIHAVVGLVSAGRENEMQDKPLVVVSADTHIGPLLKDQLRDYCPKRYLEAFDGFVAEDREYRSSLREAAPYFFVETEAGQFVRNFHNIRTAGHHDVQARLRDMDYDGVAAEVIFHGSLNDEPIPFSNLGDPKVPSGFKNIAPKDPQLAAVGRHIYNQWLADFCSVEPERHVGLAQIPVWDVDASVREIEWARSAGLRGVNFPAPQTWFPEYDKAVWEPLWAAAAAFDMPLTTHNGTGSGADYSGPGGLALFNFENTVIFGRRLLPWLIYGGVLERHPGLKVAIAEVPGLWWKPFLDDMDGNYRVCSNLPNAGQSNAKSLKDVCPRLPSSYCESQVFLGASFMDHLEAESASQNGAYRNYMWGSDYPHTEGTFHSPDDWSQEPLTHLALRFAFGEIPEAHTRAMLGENAIEIYSLDAVKLAAVAKRISAPTISSLNEPIKVPRDRVRSLAFRERGTFD